MSNYRRQTNALQNNRSHRYNLGAAPSSSSSLSSKRNDHQHDKLLYDQEQLRAKRRLDTLFILLKHRKLHFEQFNTKSNIQYQLLKWLSELSVSDMRLNSSNEAYLAYIYEMCRKDLNQIRITLPSSSSSFDDGHDGDDSDDNGGWFLFFGLSKLFTVKWVPVPLLKRSWRHLSLLSLLIVALFAYYVGLLYWRRKWRRKYQTLRWVNQVQSGSVLREMYGHYPVARTSIPVSTKFR